MPAQGNESCFVSWNGWLFSVFTIDKTRVETIIITHNHSMLFECKHDIFFRDIPRIKPAMYLHTGQFEKKKQKKTQTNPRCILQRKNTRGKRKWCSRIELIFCSFYIFSWASHISIWTALRAFSKWKSCPIYPPPKKTHISNLHSKVSWNSQLQGGNDPHKSPGYNS